MSENYTLFPDLLQMAPVVPEGSILSRTFYKDERLNAILFNFAAGEELSYDYNTGGEAGLKCRCRPGCKTVI